jgi:hypothetical protein
MQKKKTIWKSIIMYLIIIFSVFSISTLKADVDSKDASGSSSPSYKEMEQMNKELSQLKDSTLKQRNELINKLINIIKEDRYKYAGTYAAINILGQIRANEATEILLEKADYRAPVVGIAFATKNLQDYARDYPAVKALIQIHAPYERVLKEIEDINNVSLSCYVAVLAGTEGVEVSRYVIEKAIEKESGERKLTRLNFALKMINDDVPVLEENKKRVLEGRTRGINRDRDK